MRPRLLLTLFALSTSAGAVSGPSESRVPRAAEVDAIIRAVCNTKADLGRLNGCKQMIYEGRRTSAIVGPKVGLVLSTALPGTFTAPGRRELLATFCAESFSCSGETVLLRQTGEGWQAVGLVPGLIAINCLTYPRPGGIQAAVCLSEAAKNEPFGNALKIASWTGDRPKVETVALFPYLSFRDFFKPGSAQCAGRWELDPFSWDDRDRNADRVPDLTILASRTTYQPRPNLCKEGLGSGKQASGSVRNDLTFVWTGETLRPTGNTASILDRYGKGR